MSPIPVLRGVRYVPAAALAALAGCWYDEASNVSAPWYEPARPASACPTGAWSSTSGRWPSTSAATRSSTSPAVNDQTGSRRPLLTSSQPGTPPQVSPGPVPARSVPDRTDGFESRPLPTSASGDIATPPDLRREARAPAADPRSEEKSPLRRTPAHVSDPFVPLPTSEPAQAGLAPASRPATHAWAADNTTLGLQWNIVQDVPGPARFRPGVGEPLMVAQVSFADLGADFDPDISRDGRLIVFASTRHRATADIYLKSVWGRTVTQLTSDPGNDVMPRFSPDGTRIAFCSDRSGNWDIYVMPATGGQPVQITSSTDHELHPSWSPDGREIVFSRLGESSGQWEMWIVSVSNPGVVKFIGHGLFPQWCPVGGTGTGGADRIVFQRARQRGERTFGIWMLEYKDGQACNPTEIASSLTEAYITPAWSSDGDWIAYASVPNPAEWAGSRRPPRADLWMVQVTGGLRVAVSVGQGVSLMPAFGPGARLFFVSDRAGTDNIWTVDTTPILALAAANAGTGSALPAPQTSATARVASGSSFQPGPSSPSPGPEPAARGVAPPPGTRVEAASPGPAGTHDAPERTPAVVTVPEQPSPSPP